MSAIASAGYTMATFDQYVPSDRSLLTLEFKIMLAVGGFIFLLGAVPWLDYVSDDLRSAWREDVIARFIQLRGKQNDEPWKKRWRLSVNEKTALSGIVYVLTIYYIILLCWIAVGTGGPAKSPYSVILLTVAVLSTSVARKPSRAVLTVAFACLAYGVSFLVYHKFVTPFDQDPSDGLVAATSLGSVLVSVSLELIRKYLLKRKEDEAAKAG